MKQGWEIKKLGEVCEKISRGISPKYIENKGVIVLNQKCIRDHKINYAPSRKHDDVNKNVSADKYIKIGDVLVNSTGEGTLGRVAQVRDLPNEKVTVDSHISIVRPLKDKFFLDFFGWAMTFIENEIANSGAGASGQTELARTVLENNFTLVYPKSLLEQQRIVAILDTAFAAIAKAKANAEQNLKNAKELFESYLQGVFENKGDGWEEKTLGEVLLKTESVDPTKKPDEEFIYLDVSSVNKETKEIENSTVLLGKDAPSRARKLVRTNDVIFATVRPTHSRVALITEEYNEQVCSTGYFVLRAKEFLNNNLVYYFLLTYDFNKQMEKLQKGASYPAVNDSDVKGIIIPFPKSLKQQQTIVQKLDALSLETKKLEAIYQQKINDLEELKKSVLQKAFSGELKVSELGFDGLKDDRILEKDKKKIIKS